MFSALTPGSTHVWECLMKSWDHKFCSKRVSHTEMIPKSQSHELTGFSTQSCCESISRHISVVRLFLPKVRNKLQPDYLKHYLLPDWLNDSASGIRSIYKGNSKSYADLSLATLNEHLLWFSISLADFSLWNYHGGIRVRVVKLLPVAVKNRVTLV